MRILFDAYWWVEGQPSGRRVVDSLLRTWAADWPEDQLSAAVPRRHLEQARLQASALGPGRLELRPVRLAPHGVSVLAELARLATDVDVVLAQNFTPLPTQALRATFVHDLMFIEHPEFFSLTERMYFAGMPASARSADLLLTSTRAEAERIARFRPGLASRVRAVGLSVPESFAHRRARNPGLGLTPGRFLLCVGRLNVRKNVGRLVEAVLTEGLATEDRPLVVVGEPDGVSTAHTDPEDRRIRFVGGVDDCALAWLYENCRLFIFPSMDEGFGLPVVEAALSGSPMVLSDIPAFRELAPSADFFDPCDPRSIASTIRAELSRPPTPSPTVLVPTWSEVVHRIRVEMMSTIRARARGILLPRHAIGTPRTAGAM